MRSAECPSEQTALSDAPNVAETASDSAMGRVTAFREETSPLPPRGNDPLMIAQIGRCMTASLNQGDAVVCIATGTHRRLFEQQLTIRGIDVIGALMREQLVYLNALDTLTKIMVDGQPDVIRFAEVIGASVDRAATRYPRVLIFGELDLLLCSNASGSLKLVELWASFVESRPAFFRCPDLEDIRQEHSRGLFSTEQLRLRLGSQTSQAADG